MRLDNRSLFSSQKIWTLLVHNEQDPLGIEVNNMLILPGSSPLSHSKRDALLISIQKACPEAEITSIDLTWLHLVKASSLQLEAELADSTSIPRRTLDELLAYGDDITLPGTLTKLKQLQPQLQPQKDIVLFVLPRLGSVSPWSSKATDIAALCNLGTHIERLERGIALVVTAAQEGTVGEEVVGKIAHLIHDRMTEVVRLSLPEEEAVFSHKAPGALRTVLLGGSGGENAREKLMNANKELGLGLTSNELDYLIDAYMTSGSAMNRDPTDAELFMFAQVNSEHCRHKIFNASWTIDGKPQDKSLFEMIRNTERISPTGTISAYSDNAAAFQGNVAPRFAMSAEGGVYETKEEEIPILVKVETHNHPTGVSPYPGAATGSGGEIRDEGAVGRGSQPKAGLCGFTVSNLLIPGYEQPWEKDFGRPSHIASALDIMVQGPLGASAFNNEFGRPALAGYFRTFAESIPVSPGEREEVRGYHKPIMIAGGYGNVRPQFATKSKITPGSQIVVLGGPGLLIGLGGGAASSQVSGTSSAELDFASVQRDNAEMQRRCQQVINTCVSLDGQNPIESIHDVGAGGLSNALPELVHDSGLGATFEIRDVLVADSSMSPMEIWCNESQERYVLAISAQKVQTFQDIAHRERCPFSIVGVATEAQDLIVTDRLFNQDVIRLNMSTLFGKFPKMTRADTSSTNSSTVPFDVSLSKYLPNPNPISISERLAIVVKRVLRLPSVASKSFLITIGDRSITGLVTRDQMVGPWQVPVADVAVTRSSYGFDVICGEAMAMGERTPVALLNPAASARMAVAESLTNLTAATIPDLSRVKLSANWMCAASKAGEGAALYAAVKTVGMDLCPALGVGIPVGKDSMSMSMKWPGKDGNQREVSSPLSLIVTAFAPVADVRSTWTPQLRADVGEPTVLVLLDLASGKERTGGSALAQVFNQLGTEPPDVDSPAVLKAFFQGCQTIRVSDPSLVLAYHDRSDGGLFTTVAEMCFAGRLGVQLFLDANVQSPLETLFNEELGAVVQVREAQITRLREVFTGVGFPADSVRVIGRVNKNDSDQRITIMHGDECILSMGRAELQQIWAETSYRMQSLRDDDPASAQEEFELIADKTHTGLFYDLRFHPSPLPTRALAPSRPRVAILREQGVNGHAEMAWAFAAAGFTAVDVHMSDLLSGRVDLADFRGLAACGGFSYGDVLGAGKGWAHAALLNDVARHTFATFFARADTFALGVCNGCQFLSHLREIVPGAAGWPEFRRNKSGRFEGRVCMVEVVEGEATRRSVFLRGMGGSRLPVVVAHGEGRAVFTQESRQEQGLVAVRYVDAAGQQTEVYPLNPNGSPSGVTGVQTPDGRVLVLMPHPERVVTLESNSWYPSAGEERGVFGEGWRETGMGPWFRLFQNARSWCG